MFGSGILDTAIGLTLLFLFMSLIASALRELVENILKSRARNLERGLTELLGGVGTDAVDPSRFYNHPLIASLYKGQYAPGSRRLPSYIPREHFSLALLHIAANTDERPGVLSLSALSASLSQTAQLNAVQKVVLSLIDGTANDIGTLRQRVEAWYDGTMDRVSGWYTRQTAWILGFLGLCAAAFFNVDAITVGEHLMTDKSLRDAMVTQADKFLATNHGVPAKPDSLRDALNGVGVPIGWQGSCPLPQSKLSAASIEAGTSCHLTPLDCVWILFGWVITALAIMLGAPFWFDMLNRFMIIRSTIKPREKSQDEASQDKQPAPSSRT